MRLSSDIWGSGQREIGLDGGSHRGFEAVASDSLGSVEHMSSCGCPGCLAKIEIDHGATTSPQGEATRTDGGGLQFDEVPGTDSVGATTGTAGALAIGGSVNGYVNTAGDDDWYAITLVAGQSYTFSLVGGSLSDTYLELRNSAGALIGIDDDFGTMYNSTIRWTATTSGTYYLNARAYEDAVPTLTGSYTLSAVTSAPASPLDSIDYHYTMPTTNISIWFATSGYTNPSGDTAVRAWTQPEIDAVIAALGTYTAIAPLNFSIAATQGAATWIFSLADLPGNTLGYFAVGSQYAAFDPNVTNFTAGLAPGGNSWVTIIHEAGHGLGMAHPHDNGAENYGPDNSEIMQGVTGAFDSYGTFNLNQGVFTTMSYNDSWHTSGFGPTGSTLTGGQATPMALDVALIQQRYGVNNTTGSGNTAYTLALASSAYRCIWDVSGTDTISYAGSGAATIDLRAATLLNEVGGGGYVSFVQGIHGGFTIANGVLIENATGGSGNDTLIGNSANNILNGGAGVDSMTGGLGDDTYFVDNFSDLISEDVNGGTDSVTSTTTYTLLANVENLTLNGGGSEIHGNGNASNNTLTGDNAVNGLQGLGGNDILVGLGGNDMLLGGDGVDTAGYTIASTAATWTRNTDGTWTVTGQGADTLTSVEYLDFTDRDVFLDRPGSNFSTDGQSDFFLRNTSTGSMVMWFNANSATSAGMGTLSTDWVGQGFGDFNGDGRDDILWRNSTNGNMSLWFMNNQAVTGSGGYGVALSWGISGIGDINGDGRDDIVLRNSNGDLVLWFMDGLAITGAGLGNVAPVWQIEVLGDFNGDGRDDFIWRNSSTGDMSMWLMNGTAAAPDNFANVGGAWNIAGVGDLNGDGRDDVMWRNDSTGDVSLWFMNAGTITSSSGFNVGTNYQVADLGDYNGDGRDDIIWRNTTTGDVIAWYMNGAAVTGSAFLGGLNSDWVINPGG